jgi:hypothetical protein
MSWSKFADESPELAAKVRDRFEAHPHHVIATLRTDGSPRASGTNVEFNEEGDEVELRICAMARAVKAQDLRRDGRYSLHSATLDEQLDGGDAKVAGVAHVVGEPGPDDDTTFVLEIAEASLVELAPGGKELQITSWSPARGTDTLRRA